MFSANQMKVATSPNASGSGIRSRRPKTRKYIVLRPKMINTAAISSQRRSTMKWWVKKFT